MWNDVTLVLLILLLGAVLSIWFIIEGGDLWFAVTLCFYLITKGMEE